ncbi:MAG: hypothetical protein PHI19_00500 [Clostridia bacterium]|nr:hypothetical protein [Clostridia bacterium]
MANRISKKSKIQIGLLALSVVIMIFGLMFVLTASKMVPIFKGFYNIPNMVVQYIFVIATMSAGIMTFSNVAATVEDKKKRDALTLFITVFSTVLTVPLLYVFIALFPAASGNFDPVLGESMVKDVSLAFQDLFKTRGVLYLIYSLGIVMSVVFLAFPLLTGILTLKDKALKLGKGGITIGALPVVEKSLKGQR